MLKEAAGIQRVVLKTGRTDLRRGIDGLKAILFCGRRNDRIRGLTFEGDGYLLLTKRLSGENRFQWPRNEDDLKKITMEQYRNLMEGFAVEGSIREV